jgi:hypothetical protein
VALSADGQDNHNFILELDIEKEAEITHTQFPWGQRVFLKRFAVASGPVRLIDQTILDGIQNHFLVALSHFLEIIPSARRKLNRKWHGLP